MQIGRGLRLERVNASLIKPAVSCSEKSEIPLCASREAPYRSLDRAPRNTEHWTGGAFRDPPEGKRRMAATKQQAPWSVKGIERDARETAKEAAQREGMTVGAWLNQIIYHAGDPQSSGGAVDGIQLKDIITAIEALNKRTAAAEEKSADAMDALKRSFGGVVERVQRLERAKSSPGGPDLDARIARLEEKTNDRQRVDALKALEKAVGQVALQFDTAHKESVERLDAQEKQLSLLANRLEGVEGDPNAASAVNYLKNAVDGLGARISRAERIASEASQLRDEAQNTGDPQFVERTGARLRVLGDEIKRGGDHMRTLENAIVKMAKQIDAAEKRSAEGVQKVSETIIELRKQFQAMDASEADAKQEIEHAVAKVARQTDDRISALQTSFDDMIARLERTENEVAASSLNDDIFEDDPLSSPSQPAARAEAADGDDEDDAMSIFDLDDEDADNAFNVDLDDDGDAEEAKTVFDETDDILSQVRETFEASDALDADDFAEAPAATSSPQSELDAVLAELDSMGLREDKPATENDAQAFLSEPEAEAPTRKTKTVDSVKAARLAAKEAAERAEVDAASSKKRKLSPKQRAIIAARIRRKRAQAEHGSDDAPVARKRRSPAASPLFDDEPEIEEEEEITDTNPSILGKLGGAFSGLRQRLPGGQSGDAQKKNPEDDDKDPLAKFESGGSEDLGEGSGGALSHLPGKPLAIALGASILLAGVAIAFLARDMFRGPATVAPPTIIADPAAAPSTPQPSADAATAEPTAAEVPAAPTVKPRDLYFDAVAALKLAQTPEAEAAALQSLQEAAALGHPPAQLQLGELYKNGQGVDQDLSQARIWYERAASGGNILAMHRAGVMTAQGEGGSTDMNAAIAWFEQAANRGLVDSQYNLGAIFHPSTDGPAAGLQDPAKAYFWYALAAKNGDDQAEALAAGLVDSVDAAQKQQTDDSVAVWEATPANAAANELAPAS